MEEAVIVIMLKDKKTGFFDKELGSYSVGEYMPYIYNTYALEEDGKYKVYMKITCPEDVEDWQFNAIFDYYDTETLLPFVTSIEEDEQCYNPTWTVSFDFKDNIEEMEEDITNILQLHQKELKSVYDVIADKKDEYMDEQK